MTIDDGRIFITMIAAMALVAIGTPLSCGFAASHAAESCGKACGERGVSRSNTIDCYCRGTDMPK